jgi:hypothetical protein
MRVYVDTSVFGGVFDDEFSESSNIFFEQANKGIFDIVVSDVTTNEINNSPDQVQDYYTGHKQICELVAITRDMLVLQRKYIEHGIVSEKYRDDALHVACATVSGCSVIVSWNFRHIVHQQKIIQYNSVNMMNGYPALQIYSPKEVIIYEED